MTWNLTDAKNRFTEVVNRALAQGPQRVNRRGDSVVVLSWDDYVKLTGEKPSFKSMLMDGPDLDGLDLKRDPSPMREVEL
jgi:prevent-host-death family protein